MADDQEIELAWAAGFFDGEGCVSIRRVHGGAYRYLVVSVNQKREEPMRRFIAAIGTERMLSHPGNNGMYQIHFMRREAERILRLLWPYLSEPKREQAIDKGFRI